MLGTLVGGCARISLSKSAQLFDLEPIHVIERRTSSARGRQPSRARGRRAQEEGGQVGFEVNFPSGRARATFEILRILKQTRILGVKLAEILLNLLNCRLRVPLSLEKANFI